MPQFNAVATEHLIDELTHHADGKSVVDMQVVFSRVTLEVISLVSMHLQIWPALQNTTEVGISEQAQLLFVNCYSVIAIQYHIYVLFFHLL